MTRIDSIVSKLVDTVTDW